jgi:hypothetical protein
MFSIKKFSADVAAATTKAQKASERTHHIDKYNCLIVFAEDIKG